VDYAADAASFSAELWADSWSMTTEASADFLTSASSLAADVIDTPTAHYLADQVDEKSHQAADTVDDITHEASNKVDQVTHEAADKVDEVTHEAADKSKAAFKTIGTAADKANSAIAAGAKKGFEWAKEHRGDIVTIGAGVTCFVGNVAGCAVATAVAFGFRAQENGMDDLDKTAIDFGLTVATFGVGAAGTTAIRGLGMRGTEKFAANVGVSIPSWTADWSDNVARQVR
jgi:gas vesicle protein